MVRFESESTRTNNAADARATVRNYLASISGYSLAALDFVSFNGLTSIRTFFETGSGPQALCVTFPGQLAQLYHLSFERLGMGRIRRDSNVWWNSAPHDLAILLHLVPRRVVRARLHEHAHLRPGIADMAVCDLELEDGISAHLYLSWLHPENTASVTVVGSERMLRYEGRFEKRTLTLYDYALDTDDRHGNLVPVRQFAARPLEVPAGAEPLGLAARHFVDSIRTGTEPLSSGARSLRVVEVLEAAEHAATRHSLDA